VCDERKGVPHVAYSPLRLNSCSRSFQKLVFFLCHHIFIASFFLFLLFVDAEADVSLRTDADASLLFTPPIVFLVSITLDRAES